MSGFLSFSRRIYARERLLGVRRISSCMERTSVLPRGEEGRQPDTLRAFSATSACVRSGCFAEVDAGPPFFAAFAFGWLPSSLALLGTIVEGR